MSSMVGTVGLSFETALVVEYGKLITREAGLEVEQSSEPWAQD